MRTFVCGLWGCLCLAVVGCGEGAISSAPSPPDLTALQAAYDSPDGLLDARTAPMVLADLVRKYRQLLVLAELVGVAAQSFVEVLDEDEPGEGASSLSAGLSVRRAALSGRFGMWAQITYVCTGWSPEADPKQVDASWGSLELQNVFEGAAPGPITWGEARDCQMEGSDGQRQRFDGQLRALLAGDQFLLSFEGTWLDEAEQVEAVVIDLRSTGGALEVRSIVEGGSIVVGVVDPGQLAAAILCGDAPGCPDLGLTVRDRQGAWSCGIGRLGVSGTCRLGGREVGW